MLYKAYGKTGKMVSAIGMGGMRFNAEDYTNGFENAVKVIHRASELGINYFDTAPYYCDDKSEEIFGAAFRSMPNPFYVSSKTGERDGKKARENLERSLKRLGLEKINFYNIWCVMDYEDYLGRMKKGGPYEELVRAKNEGLIEHIVMSTHANGEDIAKILEDRNFEGVTLGYNASNFKFRQQGITAAYGLELGVVTMNPLGGGFITKNPETYSYIKKDDDESLAVAALKFNASHKEITVTLAGMGTVSEVEENVKAGENLVEFTASELLEMSKNITAGMDSLCTMCGYCSGCPADIDIPKYMDAYNSYILSDKENIIKDRLKNHWGLKPDDAGKCVECGACLSKCTQKLPIIDRLKFIAGKA